MSDWEPVTTRYEVLRSGNETVYLQVDEHEMPYTPEPLRDSQGREVTITCTNATLKIF